MKKNRLSVLFYISVLFFSFQGLTCNGSTNVNDFKVVGFHLDLRIQVMKPEALKDFAKELAGKGINTLIMEWEGTFPFEKHPLIPNKYAYTKNEIKEFISFCSGLNIDVIPLQQTLGHMEYILQHYRYKDQRENQNDFSQICPLKTEDNKKLFTELFKELIQLHPSKYIHVGGDEAYYLGFCDKCSRKVKDEGISKLVADHLKMVCEIVISLGKTPVLWADMATKYPYELSILPNETVFIEWNYGWEIDRYGDLEVLVNHGFEVWGAPSIRSHPDNFFLSLWEKHFNNIRDFIPYCREAGYKGIVITSWSTSGLYSYVYEDKKTVSELIPIRHVYPISGYNILIDAYMNGVQNPNPLDINEFIITYCKEHYDFNRDQAILFWKSLNKMPYQIIDGDVEGKEIPIKEMLDSFKLGQKELYKLNPQSNKAELDHFRLMADIRENYLSFKYIENKANGKAFSKDEIPFMLEQLNNLLEKDDTIALKYEELNSHLLYPTWIEEENRVRRKNIIMLYNRLSKAR